MFVGKYMSSDVVTIHPTASVEDAFYLMREHDIEQLPVLDFDGTLLGVVTERDLLLVSPSPTASLTIHEMLYALSNLKISEIIPDRLFTVEASAPLEEAAIIMLDNQLDALPVLRNGELVGIITEEDIFRVFVQAVDNSRPAVQLTILIPDEKGVIAYLARQIADAGGLILSLGEFGGRQPGTRTLTLNVDGLTMTQLRDIAAAAERDIKCRLLDLRETESLRAGG